MWTRPIRRSLRPRSRIRPSTSAEANREHEQRRHFQEYFVTHLPSSSLHPDAKSVGGPHHGLPRDKGKPHDPEGKLVPAAPPPMVGLSREMTVLRIPIKSAKHHFGVALSRGQRPYNEDCYQVGTIDVPAFAKRRPVSLTRSGKQDPSKVTPTGQLGGDPQVFYFAVFDGHGGSECSDFLRAELHKYIEQGAKDFELESSLRRKDKDKYAGWHGTKEEQNEEGGQVKMGPIHRQSSEEAQPMKPPEAGAGEKPPTGSETIQTVPTGDSSVKQSDKIHQAEEMERELVKSWKELVGGYYRRFKPEYFALEAGGQGHFMEKEAVQSRQTPPQAKPTDQETEGVGLETVLQYSFLKADYDFVSAQAEKVEDDPVQSDKPINENDLIHDPSDPGNRLARTKPFKGGSTGSIALISTPTPSPFWHPSSPCTIMTAHVGDTRVIVCQTATGLPVPLTTNHHPNDPHEATRMRRFAATFVTDSFGEERVAGLANTRAFGDMSVKRIGVSAEAEIHRVDVLPAEYSFMVLMSDGVSGHLSDQEIVDIVKEAKTPEQGARDVVSFSTHVAPDADNATALVVRLGGWERRIEGGLGSMGTKELRDWRKDEAENPRSRTQ